MVVFVGEMILSVGGDLGRALGGVLGGALACWREGVIIDWVIWWGFWWLVSWVKMLHTTKMGGKVLSRSVGPLCGVACLLF